MAKKSLGPLPDIEIPDTYLTRICHGTTILFNGRIWKKGDFDPKATVNFIDEGSDRVSLIDLETFARLENKYRKDNNEAIRVAHQQLMKHDRGYTDIDLNELEIQTMLKAYVVGNIFPKWGLGDKDLGREARGILKRGTNVIEDQVEDAREDTISFSKQKTPESIYDMLRQRKRPSFRRETKKAVDVNGENGFDRDSITISRSADKRSLLTTKVLKEKNIFIHYEKLYTLINKPYFDEPVINLRGKLLYPYPGVKIGNKDIYNLIQLRKAYKRAFLSLFRQEALDNDPYKRKLKHVHGRLDNEINSVPVQRQGFSLQWVGKNKAYLCKNIDEFVLKELKSEGKRLHWFGPTKIGVELTMHTSGSISHGAVVVMDSYYPFPFLNSSNPRSNICTGDGKEIYSDSSKTDEQQIVGKINIGEHTMYRGYHGTFTPHSELSNQKYNKLHIHSHHKIISKDEMEARNLKPSNV